MDNNVNKKGTSTFLFITANAEIIETNGNKKRIPNTRGDEEYKKLTNCLIEYSYNIKGKFAVTRDNLINAISAEQAVIVHFANHGDEKGNLFLTNKNYEADPLSIENIRSYFSEVNPETRPSFVFFNVCNSHELAMIISQIKGITYAFGWDGKVKVEDAINFAENFYKNLGDFDVTKIENAFDTASSTKRESLAIPVLYKCGRIVKKSYNIFNKNYSLKLANAHQKYAESIDSVLKNIENLTNTAIFLDELFKNAVDNIKDILDEKGLLFIEAPMLSGKSTLIKYFVKKFRNEFNFIDCNANLSVYKNKMREASTIFDFYVLLTKVMLDGITSKKPRLLNRILENTKALKAIIECGGSLSYFENLINFISDSIENIKLEDFNIGKNSKKNLILLYIDDFHSIINTTTFIQFLKDVQEIDVAQFSANSALQNVKVILLTRYFPKKRLHNSVYLIKDFNENDIRSLIELLQEFKELSLSEKNVIIDSILHYTGGHPWFINRFLQIFSSLRKEKANVRVHTIELMHIIFTHSEYWISDKIFKKRRNSSFLSETLKLINYFRDQRQDFLDFLETAYDSCPDQSSILTAQSYRSNLILRQSGYARIQTDDNNKSNEIIKELRNRIIRDYYIEFILENY